MSTALPADKEKYLFDIGRFTDALVLAVQSDITVSAAVRDHCESVYRAQQRLLEATVRDRIGRHDL